jgi:CTP:molybdopterin cytidylyltransferase MocA
VSEQPAVFVDVQQIADHCKVSIATALEVAGREHITIWAMGGQPVVLLGDADRLASEIGKA